MKLVVVAGTGTEVGKTWFTARVIEHLRAAGATVGARKPAQSYDPDDPHPTDATVLAAATGEDPATVCGDTLSYPIPLAPPMAAEAMGRPVPTVADLASACAWPSPPPAVAFVELAGGVRSPMAADGDGVALTEALAPDLVLLVADAGLGTINSVRLTVAALGPERPILVALNRFHDNIPLHQRNLEWMAARDGLDVVTTPTDAAARLHP